MFQDAYVKCDRLETENLLKELGGHLEGAPFPPDTTVIMSRPLPFYPGYQFLDIADHMTMPARRRFVIYKDNDVVVLDFTNDPIYALNARAPIVLTDEILPDYIRFFFSFVRGPHGRFLICESVDDIQWHDDPPPSARRAVGNMLRPLEIHHKDEDGTAYLMARMVFKDTLFQTNIAVKPDGMVRISDEKVLVENMPVLDDTFGQ
jgi:hypothetical protein